jgi:hypothetical protein
MVDEYVAFVEEGEYETRNTSNSAEAGSRIKTPADAGTK